MKSSHLATHPARRVSIGKALQDWKLPDETDLMTFSKAVIALISQLDPGNMKPMA